jgi:segregation and condensation protein B
MATLDAKLEAVLFHRAEALTKKYVATLLEVSAEELESAISILSEALAMRGVRLLHIGEELELITAPEVSDVITKTRKEELVRDLGKAGSETLSVILYRGPISRVEIDYIRGVNCSFIVRNLLIRGLIDRVANPKNARSVLYQATPKLLAHLGVARIEDLPGYADIRAQITSFEAQSTQEAGVRLEEES